MFQHFHFLGDYPSVPLAIISNSVSPSKLDQYNCFLLSVTYIVLAIKICPQALMKQTVSFVTWRLLNYNLE